MTQNELRQRKQYWQKYIRRWQKQPIDRSHWQLTTLDDLKAASENLVHLSVEERIEHLMRLRWMNYGPDALYGRLERVFAIGELESAPVPRRRRSSHDTPRPRPRHPGH